MLKNLEINTVKQKLTDKLNYTEDDIKSLEFQYCTECIIIGDGLDRKKINIKLADCGDSLILAGNKEKIKIHMKAVLASNIINVFLNVGLIFGRDTIVNTLEYTYFSILSNLWGFYNS